MAPVRKHLSQSKMEQQSLLSTPLLVLLLQVVVGIVLLHSSVLLVVQAQEDDICYIGDGLNQYEFQNGDSLGDLFMTRCSNTGDFTCFCNTNKYPNVVDCPYCGFETNEVQEEDGYKNKLVCARHDETIEFVNVDGVAQSCTCHVPMDGITSPIPNCKPVDIPGKCTLELLDGTVQTFENGESFGNALETRCNRGREEGGGGGGEEEGPQESSSEYPCFCNTNLPGQGIDCPYCPLLDFYPNDNDGSNSVVDPTLICARHEETVLITESNGRDEFLCTCTIPDDPLIGAPETNCILVTQSPSNSPSDPPSTTPSNRPTISPSQPLDTLAPTKQPTTTSPTTHPSPLPTTLPTTQAPTIDDPPSPISILPPAFISNDRGCFINNEQDGTLVFITEGTSFGDLVTGPCGPSNVWPTFCNPSLPGGGTQEYPYCVFLAASGFETTSTTTTTTASNSSTTTIVTTTTTTTSSTDREIVCARDGERVSFVDYNTGMEQTCGCLYLSPSIGALSSCQQLEESSETPTTVPTMSPTSSAMTMTTMTTMTTKRQFATLVFVQVVLFVLSI